MSTYLVCMRHLKVGYGMPMGTWRMIHVMFTAHPCNNKEAHKEVDTSFWNLNVFGCSGNNLYKALLRISFEKESMLPV